MYIVQVTFRKTLLFLGTKAVGINVPRGDGRWFVQRVSEHTQPELLHHVSLRHRAGVAPPDGEIAQSASTGPRGFLHKLCNERGRARLEHADELEQLKPVCRVPEPAVAVLVERHGSLQPH